MALTHAVAGNPARSSRGRDYHSRHDHSQRALFERLLARWRQRRGFDEVVRMSYVFGVIDGPSSTRAIFKSVRAIGAETGATEPVVTDVATHRHAGRGIALRRRARALVRIRRELLAVVRLYKALGGGWQEAAPER